MARDSLDPSTHDLLAERVAVLRKQVEAQRQQDEEIARLAEERRKMIVEEGIDTLFQRFDLEPEP